MIAHVRAGRGPGRGSLPWRRRFPMRSGAGEVEGFGGRVEPTEAADAMEAGGQDVLEEATDEFVGLQVAVLPATRSALPIAPAHPATCLPKPPVSPSGLWRRGRRRQVGEQREVAVRRWRWGFCDREDDGELELGGGADPFDLGGPGATEGFLQNLLTAQRAWVELERVKRRSVLRWRKYRRNSSGVSSSGACGSARRVGGRKRGRTSGATRLQGQEAQVVGEAD